MAWLVHFIECKAVDQNTMMIIYGGHLFIMCKHGHLLSQHILNDEKLLKLANMSLQTSLGKSFGDPPGWFISLGTESSIGDKRS